MTIIATSKPEIHLLVTDAWAIFGLGDQIIPATMRFGKGQAWWAFTQSTGKSRREAHQDGFKAEKLQIYKVVKA